MNSSWEKKQAVNLNISQLTLPCLRNRRKKNERSYETIILQYQHSNVHIMTIPGEKKRTERKYQEKNDQKTSLILYKTLITYSRSLTNSKQDKVNEILTWTHDKHTVKRKDKENLESNNREATHYVQGSSMRLITNFSYKPMEARQQ